MIIWLDELQVTSDKFFLILGCVIQCKELHTLVLNFIFTKIVQLVVKNGFLAWIFSGYDILQREDADNIFKVFFTIHVGWSTLWHLSHILHCLRLLLSVWTKNQLEFSQDLGVVYGVVLDHWHKRTIYCTPISLAASTYVTYTWWLWPRCDRWPTGGQWVQVTYFSRCQWNLSQNTRYFKNWFVKCLLNFLYQQRSI